jgi:uncharacterized membrane protein required for colicin V production
MPLFNTPFNAMDLLIILLFVSGVYTGYKQGFVISFLKFFGYIIGIIMARLYYDEFVILLKTATPLEIWVRRFYENHMADFFTEGLASKPEILSILPYGQDLGQLKTIFQLNQSDMGTAIHTYLVSQLTALSMNLLSMILLFFLIIIGLHIITQVLDVATKLPIIKGLNKLGGLFFGFIKMFILISIGLLVVVAFSSLSKTGFLVTQLDFSILAPYFMRYNVLLIFIGSTLLGL